MNPSLSQAGNTSSRIDLIDALRGFTLLGIIIAHMTEQYYAGAPPEKYAGQTTATVVDSIASVLVGTLITGKFYMIFSFLFGMSFFIQFSHAKSTFPFLLKFAWRLVLLFIIGLIHHAHYRGDILSIYAMLGFVLLITYRLPDKYLLILGILLVVDLPAIVTRVVALLTHDTSQNALIHQDQHVLLSYYETFKSGAYFDILKANLADFKTKMDYQIWSGRLYMTMGLFILGYYAGKQKFFEDISSKLPFVKKIVRVALWSLLGVFLTGIAFFAVGNGMLGGLSEEVNIAIGVSFFDLLNACLATLYVCWFILLFQKEKWRPRLMYFYESGRMGLTTYLMQSMFGLLIYSSMGLGLLGELGSATSFLLAIILFALQIGISRFWLSRFQYGPVEWIWRSLTNLKIQPLVTKTVVST